MAQASATRRGVTRGGSKPSRSASSVDHSKHDRKTRTGAQQPKQLHAAEVGPNSSVKKAGRVRAIAQRTDLLLVQFVHAAEVNLLAMRLGGRPKSKAVSARVNPDLLAAAGARLGLTNQSDVLNAGLALLAGADTYGAWLFEQAGTIPVDLEVDV